MLPFRGSATEAVFAFASLLISIVIVTPSRSCAAFASDLPIEVDTNSSTLVSIIHTEKKLERRLFELAPPFDFVNDQCAFACNAQEEQSEDNGEGPLINACPKVSLHMIVMIPLLTLKCELESYSTRVMEYNDRTKSETEKVSL